MKLKKNLILIGMMSSGKSTMGKRLAKITGYSFFDVDQVIEERTNMKISEIFELKGETFFRNLEEKITLNLMNINGCIISLGGGGFINKNIRKEAITKSETFWLDWNPNTLINRIRRNKNRPIALTLNNIELKNLITKRSKYYSKAKHKINCQKLNKSKIIKKILNLYENSQH